MKQGPLLMIYDTHSRNLMSIVKIHNSVDNVQCYECKKVIKDYWFC